MAGCSGKEKKTEKFFFNANSYIGVRLTIDKYTPKQACHSLGVSPVIFDNPQRK